jgi:superfamily II DNA or RNA helicase
MSACDPAKAKTSDPASSAHSLDTLRRELAEARMRVAKLEEDVEWMESRGQIALPESAASSPIQTPRTSEEKIALFLDLFGTRREVYPKRWDNTKTGKSGYSPACDNEWRPGICRKPQVKCSECAHQQFPPLDARAVEQHLRGVHTAGVYAIAEDSTCRFLAADFDGDAWSDDVAAYREAGAKAGVQIAVERSRSGNGAHGWVFFREPVPASLARKLGTLLLAKAAARRPSMSLAAFDRLFPNQDVVPVGGWGNLIALPLAKGPRQAGNTVFIDDALRPIDDQWAYLAGWPRISTAEVREIVERLAPLPALSKDMAGEAPALELQADESTLDLARPTVRRGMMSGELTIRVDSKVHVPRTVPAPVLAALRRLACFANPVFHEKLRLRFSTFDTPRFLFAGEWRPDRLVLPRGVLDPCLQILEEAGASVSVQDERTLGKRCAWHFSGELRSEQQAAIREMVTHDIGVLCAPPGAGKTVMGCALIARHRTSALVLVHRTVLLDQWRETAIRFLGLKKSDIGVWRGAKPRLTRRIDIAMLPSVIRAEDYAAAFSGYGLVIVDECHHVPAVSFEQLLKDCPARRVYGLTATPYRKDKLEKLLHLQCGPIRHTIALQTGEAAGRKVIVRRNTFSLPMTGPASAGIHEVWDALIKDRGRLDLIVSDIAACTAEGRSPLVLADRTGYLDAIETALAEAGATREVTRFRLAAAMGKKQRADVRARIDGHFREGRPFVLLATASLIGEGFDLPQLDTLILAMPLSFKGRLIQYAGRLHRTHEGKGAPRIHDYLDDNCALTRAMFRRRMAGYRQMGYRVELTGEHGDGGDDTEAELDLR